MPSVLDIIIGCVMSVSVIMAFFRGFVKEFFTVLAWILATIITIYLSPVVQELLSASDGKKAFYDALSVLVIFTVSMIFFSFVFGRVIHHLKKNDGLFLDRSLGVLFGLIRGVLLICLGYIFLVGFIYEEKPTWVKGKFVKLVEIGSSQLVKLNPKNIEVDLDKIMPKRKKKTDDGEGYTDEERKQVEELIENGIL